MEDRFTYGLNPEKLGAVSSYLCDPNTAPAEFLLVKSQYLAETGRAVSRGALFFQIRQAFLPGEVTAEEANRIGYETAMRWTKGKYQFFVCTHTDKAHIHNHIYFNSTAFDRSRKFHNFIGSSFALRRLSDRVCIEHELSVIQNRASTARAAFFTMASGLGKSRPLPSSGCDWLFSPLWRKSPRTLRLSSSHGGVRLCRKQGAAVSSHSLRPDRKNRPGSGLLHWEPDLTRRTSRR